jgi:hypothetical protein
LGGQPPRGTSQSSGKQLVTTIGLVCRTYWGFQSHSSYSSGSMTSWQLKSTSETDSFGPSDVSELPSNWCLGPMGGMKGSSQRGHRTFMQSALLGTSLTLLSLYSSGRLTKSSTSYNVVLQFPEIPEVRDPDYATLGIPNETDPVTVP